MTRLDELLPGYQFRERRGLDVVATPEAVWAALRHVTLGEMPLVRLLFGVRSLPALVSGHAGLPSRAEAPLLDQMLAFGFTLLADEAGREVVVGLVAQMWKLGGGPVPIRGDAGFRAFEEPGFAKVAMNFLLSDHDGVVHLETETRVATTDVASRRAFRRYWWVIRAPSGAIRRNWLRAVARRAERSPDPR